MAAPNVDMELKKAFQELQVKMIETTQKLKMADMQAEQCKRYINHAKLTESEILALPEKTRMYESVGRMFILSDGSKLKQKLTTKIESQEEKIKNLQNTKSYLEKSLKESEDNLREMISAKKAK